MLRIAMVIPTIDAIGGAERQVLLLAVGLQRRGHAVTVIALSGDGGVETGRLASADVGFVALGMRKAWIDPRGWWRYFQWARRHRPEIIHAHLPHGSWFARWVRLIYPVRVVVDTIHTSNASDRGRRLGYRLSGWLSNQVTCVSNAVAESARGLMLTENLAVLPNGVVLPEWDGRETRREGRRDGGFRWVAVGRLERVKDYPTLLRAVALVGAATLTIAGCGREEAALHELAGQLGIGGRVSFDGFQTEIDGWLRSADGFVLSSLWEGLPVSVLEGQAMGLPVVATDGKGTREAMIPGVTGLIVPVGDVEALSRAMQAIMDMPAEQRRAMGAAGRALVEERFSLPVVAERWEKLYGKLMDKNPQPRRCAR